jgi:GNAT superfamily N-acetyltransferase
MKKIEDISYRDLEITNADNSEMPAVLSLLKDAALWLKENNIDYWQNWINPKAIFISWIRQGFEDNEFFIVRYNDEVIGTFRLQWSDELFWKNKKDKAGYIHSFTTLRKYKGKHLGTKILEWIEDYCKKNNKDYLRLDCGVSIVGLNEYYIKHNFKNMGILNFNHNGHKEKLNLYEKKL